ncbi:hypothetical protein HPB50_000344 [Hyalomma asiaticum]|uniref:Uncharacterized protein n=1 Tax=Hyalomma asiaticum TaxID=266040 RepID=A0ACB7S3F5_HYAAI|nr:hypothetical protein HPB50_000344 [Hyalomma asiaticum]
MAAVDTVKTPEPSSTRNVQTKGRAQPAEGDAEGGDADTSDSSEAGVLAVEPVRPQGHPQDTGDDVLVRRVFTLVWVWGLLPGVLAGVTIAYFLWSTMTLYMREVTKALLYVITVPPSRQNSTQKAAGLFRACISMANTTRSEVSSLKKFLSLVGLDMSDMPPDPKFSIADRIVRLNLEYGFPSVVRFGFIAAKSVEKKVLDLNIDKEYALWMKRGLSSSNAPGYLQEYDPNLNASQLTRRIREAERNLIALIRTLEEKQNYEALVVTIGAVGALMEESVGKGEWLRLIIKYTGGAYNSSDLFVVWANSTDLVKLLVANGEISLEDARLVLSWNLIRQLLPLSSGSLMAELHKDFSDTCFDAVSAFMEVAVMNSYLRRSPINDRRTSANSGESPIVQGRVVGVTVLPFESSKQRHSASGEQNPRSEDSMLKKQAMSSGNEKHKLNAREELIVPFRERDVQAKRHRRANDSQYRAREAEHLQQCRRL